MVLLKISAVVVVAIAMALALAHALELPGKMRLQKEQYLAVQAIYYPGFTIGGAAEPVSVLLTALLAFLTPSGSLSFWLTLGACCALALMQVVYWAFIPGSGMSICKAPALPFSDSVAAGRRAQGKQIGPIFATAGNTLMSRAQVLP